GSARRRPARAFVRGDGSQRIDAAPARLRSAGPGVRRLRLRARDAGIIGETGDGFRNRSNPPHAGQIRGETQMNLTQALGWTLIHFLWQGAIVAIALACVLLLLRRKAPTTRYAAGCAAMMLMLLFAGATFIDFAFSTKGSVAAPVRFVQ